MNNKDANILISWQKLVLCVLVRRPQWDGFNRCPQLHFCGRKKLSIHFAWKNITKTYLYYFDPLKLHFYIVKLGFTGVYIIFLISAQKHRLWVLIRTASPAGLGGSVGCVVRLETRRSRVQPLPRSATFFRGDWLWNIFYGHSFPSADSRRVVVSFWRKNVHNTG